MSPAPAIHTTRLGKRYGPAWALQDCSVSVPPGHVTALVGPNGDRAHQRRGGTARPCLLRTPAHSTFSARVANLGAPIEAASTI